MKRIGIVNRGEPAVRFLATLQGMAFSPGGAPESVALYTEADAEALFVRRADHAYCIGAARGAYLDAGAVLAGLRETGCDAAWLGWGFASEDAQFAAALEAAGIALLAPRPETMALLGDKIRAKQLAERCDVPVAPWAIVDSPEAAEAAALGVGLPLLVKAAGGGGGRGIRRVDRLEEVAAAFVAARDEAARSFRSDGVMLERLIDPARHIEVQVLGDGAGEVVTLGLRDCSLQRRRQKVIEEAPAPALPEATARRLLGAARRLCAAARYRSAGTVEFLYDPTSDQACFLEVNTRLQVEHPVTEAIYGLDLVRAQIELAQGRSLAEVAEGHAPRGWAVEARICAEDPQRGFAPAPGRIVRFVPPSGPGLRMDTGFSEGDRLSSDFDPLVAKLIAWGPDRPTAIGRLARALEQTRLVIEGGTSNLAWLRRLLDAPEFQAGQPDIGLVDRLIPAAPPGAWVAAVAAVVDRFLAEGDAGLGPDRHRVELGEPVAVYRMGPHDFRLVAAGGTLDVERRALSESEVVLRVGAARFRVERAPGDDTFVVDGVPHRVEADRGGALVAPSAALVLAVPLAEGARVAAGDCVAVVESMKMEVQVRAPQAGRLREIRVAPGEQVSAGQVLAVVEPEGAPVATAAPLASAPWGTTDPRPPAQRLVAGLIGWDRDPSQVPLDQEALAAADAPAVLTAFADVAAVFERRPGPGLDGAAAPVSADLWIETLRQRGPAALSPERRAAVARALAHHEVSLEAEPAILHEALRRLARAGQALQAQAPVALAALARLTAADGPVPIDLLNRLADLDPARHGAVAEAADHTRYVRDERPAFERLCRLGDLRAGALLERLRAGRADFSALAEAPEALLCGMAQQALSGCPVAAEAVARRLEWHPEAPVRPAAVGGHPGFLVGGEEALRWVFTVAPEDAPGLILAVAEAGVALLRLDVILVGEGDAAALVDGCVAALGLGDAPRSAQPAPWQILWLAGAGSAALPAARAFAGFGPELALWRDLLPATAERLQLGRLAAFEVDRRPAQDEVVLLRARAHSNPDDVRLLAHGEIRSLARAKGDALRLPHVERVLHAAVRALQAERQALDPRRRMHWNRITLHVLPVVPVPAETLHDYIARLAPAAARVGLEKVIVRARFADPAAPGGVSPLTDLAISRPGGQLRLQAGPASDRPLEPRTDYETRVVAARRRGLSHPHEWVALLEAGGDQLPAGRFEEYGLEGGRLVPVLRDPGANPAAVVVGVLRCAGLPARVLLLSDATRAMGALAEPECARIIAALDLAAALEAPVEWIAVSAGARIDLRTGTENLDWTARVLRRIVEFTQAGGEIDLIVPGVCVGAQAYWNAEATMLMHTRGLLIMTDRGSMVLTGKRALDFSGCVSAEDDLALGGYTTVMGPNGQAQAYAPDLFSALQLMSRYRALTGVHPGERRPRRSPTVDPEHRDLTRAPYPEALGHGFARVGDLFSARHNPDRKRPFAVRPVMDALRDGDSRPIERWGGLRDAETAVVWEARIGGFAATLIGIENQPVERLGAPTEQGPTTLAGGTLYPQAARKIARALNAASGRRPAVILANLSGFDGSPESLARWQLEFGGELGRAVVNFSGAIVFVVLSRYHGGAYVVFSKALNPGLRAVALEGSFASVIGGAPAAAVVFGREVAQRAAALGGGPDARAQATAEVAREFDAVHSVERARAVGSIDDIIAPEGLRPYVIAALRADHEGG